MESLVLALAHYGYSIVFFAVLAESIGMPVPAAIALVAAGAASIHGAMHPAKVLGSAVAAMLIGDNLLFLGGRYTGWWLLSVLCRFSLNPEACILTSADTFHRRGRVILLFAKFLPGVNTMAPPLAGSMGLPYREFLPLDFGGTALYVLSYFAAGYLFSDFLRAMLRGYSLAGAVFGWAIAVLAALWIANRFRLWLKLRGGAAVPALAPEEVVARPNVAIFDVRSHGYYDEGTLRIRGSTRLEPNALSGQLDRIPRDREIILYCTCLREATAIRVARLLAEKGVPSAVILGGLSAWKKAGLPLEPVPADDVVPLPKFA